MTKDKTGGGGGDLLDDIDITAEEIGRIKTAFKNDEFKKLFAEYIDEIGDPENRRIYESELTQLEAERGIDITFIHPTPGYVLKTTSGGTLKTFINVASCERIAEPTSRTAQNAAGSSGIDWSLPYAQSPMRKDFDQRQSLCHVYDVVFHPAALRMAQQSAPFKELLTSTALDAVQQAFGVVLDVVNVACPKLAFKGTPRATVIRKKAGVQPAQMPEPSPLDSIYPKLLAHPASATATTATSVKAATTKPNAGGGYTTPTYTLVHRKHVEYEELTNEIDAKIRAAIPHELVLTVELPLLRNCADATLDVTSRAVFVISERPAKYRLEVSLPYAVFEARGTARFDREQRRLVVTLPVIRTAPSLAQVCGATDEAKVVEQIAEVEAAAVNTAEALVVEVNPDTKNLDEDTATDKSTVPKATVEPFLDDSILYHMPSFSCNEVGEPLTLKLDVSNVDPTTLIIDELPQSFHVRFQSIGAGYYRQHYALYVRLPSNSVDSIQSVQSVVGDANITMQVQLSADAAPVSEFEAGVNSQTTGHYQRKGSENATFPIQDKSTENGDNFNMAKLASALPNPNSPPAQTSSPLKSKQRSYSESHAANIYDQYDEDDHDDHHHRRHHHHNGGQLNTSSPAKLRTYSECSVDDSSSLVGGKCLKGILKRRSSSVLSGSQSSFDEPCSSRSVEHSVGGSSIQEEIGADGGSEHCKKSVRFDNKIHKLLFRFNSTVVGQRKPKPNKRKKKKRCSERRYSEGEASDYDPKNTAEAEATSSGPSSPTSLSVVEERQRLYDSGVDMRGDDLSASKCHLYLELM